MRAYKVIVIITLFMVVFALFIVPIQDGLFPAWMNTNLIEFMLALLLVVLVVSLMR